MQLRNMGTHKIIYEFISRSHNADPEYPLRPEKWSELKKKLQQILYSLCLAPPDPGTPEHRGVCRGPYLGTVFSQCARCVETPTDFSTSLRSVNLMAPKYHSILKGKAIPLQAWTGPEGSRRLRLPDVKTISP